MNDQTPDFSRIAQSWDSYWHGTGEVGAFTSGGASHPAIKAFWEQFFMGVKDTYSAPVMMDIASGNGAVIETALAVFGNAALEISCVDVSGSAIANIQSRFPAVRGMVTDARSIPLDSASFNIVTSQFGVEYAGLEAIDEAARLLGPGGTLALLLHNREGTIHQECAINLESISRLRESNFIPRAFEMFRAGFEAVRGADRQPYEQAAKELAPAVKAIEDIMHQYGQQVADETIARLYHDVSHIHSNIQRYGPDEVLGWLNRMQEEVDGYAGRMSSMCDSAIDQETFDRICVDLPGRKIAVDKAGPLLAPGLDLPLAWVLLATADFGGA